MKTFNDITLPENWNEVSIKQFIRFIKWVNGRPEAFNHESDQEIYDFDLIRVFACEDIDSNHYEKFTLKDIPIIITSLKQLAESIPKFEVKDNIIINDILYSFPNMEDFNAGEYISFRKLGEMYEGFDVIPHLAAIICRPATKHFDTELNKDVYKVEDFDSKKLKHRVDIMSNAPAIELMGAINFFLTGNEILMKILKSSTKKKEKVEAEF